MAERLLATHEVAQMLGISREAVLRRWRLGDLPGFRLSTRVLRFRESELLDWLETRRLGVAAESQPRLIRLSSVAARRMPTELDAS